mmetsp:Transcript_7057/g.16119  ORF Transcript_7057/g.16119 Transcript_7057/m.16119 type:complete len:224 (-) Transcript_7057:280-951(-)
MEGSGASNTAVDTARCERRAASTYRPALRRSSNSSTKPRAWSAFNAPIAPASPPSVVGAAAFTFVAQAAARPRLLCAASSPAAPRLGATSVVPSATRDFAVPTARPAARARALPQPSTRACCAGTATPSPMPTSHSSSYMTMPKRGAFARRFVGGSSASAAAPASPDFLRSRFLPRVRVSAPAPTPSAIVGSSAHSGAEAEAEAAAVFGCTTRELSLRGETSG